ncbi:MAG: hypothetical protein VYA32_06955 [Planctomycetota bacterium]|nr:hypothetical protein [Planctomycetota bacterium]
MPIKVAAILTCFRHRSHANVILENFLEPYLFRGQRVDPRKEFRVVSMYVDQFPKVDMARGVARDYKIKIQPTITKALCQGGRRLAVDAVLSIGEHGTYSFNRLGQKRYPRKRFFDEIAQVIGNSSRTIPVFNDKHLCYRFDWARQMYETARELDIPLMAGSSCPLAQRQPPTELPRGARIAEAVSIHGGPLEAYGFHALEVLQSFVEARVGGETGVVSVEYLRGRQLWNAARKGRWSLKLAEAAMQAELGTVRGSIQQVPGETRVASDGLLIEYADGLKATMLNIGKNDTRWNFACRLVGERQVHSTALNVGPWKNRNLFKALVHSIQSHFRKGRSPYPVERTLMTTGLTDAMMQAAVRPGHPLHTPELEFGYKPRSFKAMRENGASWKIITDDVPEPRGIDNSCG